MGNSQRRKGKDAELELAEKLRERLGVKVERNLNQNREGGYDLKGLPVALEVKRREALSLTTWWEQAVEQAVGTRKLPVLAWRQNRQPWRFRVPLPFFGAYGPMSVWIQPKTLEHTADIDLETFCFVLQKVWL